MLTAPKLIRLYERDGNRQTRHSHAAQLLLRQPRARASCGEVEIWRRNASAESVPPACERTILFWCDKIPLPDPSGSTTLGLAALNPKVLLCSGELSIPTGKMATYTHSQDAFGVTVCPHTSRVGHSEAS
jgi:hypothetical protein